MTVPPNWSLPTAVRARVSPNSYGRQRAIAEEGHLLLVLHRPPGPDDATREGVVFWRSPAGEWQTSRGGAGTGGLKRLVTDYADLEAKLTGAFEGAHDLRILFDVLEAATPLARAARNLSAALQAGREAAKEDAFLIEMRDASSDVERNADLLLEDVRHAIQYRTVRDAEEQARLTREAVVAGHRLNLIAALFLPLTAIGSLFGMNLANGLGAGSTSTFWAILALSLVLGSLTVVWVLKKPRT